MVKETITIRVPAGLKVVLERKAKQAIQPLSGLIINCLMALLTEEERREAVEDHQDEY